MKEICEKIMKKNYIMYVIIIYNNVNDMKEKRENENDIMKNE